MTHQPDGQRPTDTPGRTAPTAPAPAGWGDLEAGMLQAAAAAPESIRAHLRNNPNTPQVLQTLEALTGFPCDFLTDPAAPAAPGPSAAQLNALVRYISWTSEGDFSATQLLDAARTLTAGGTIPDPDSPDGRAAHLLAALMTTADAQHLDGFQVAADGLRDRLHRLLDEVAAESRQLADYLTIPF